MSQMWWCVVQAGESGVMVRGTGGESDVVVCGTGW